MSSFGSAVKIFFFGQRWLSPLEKNWPVAPYAYAKTATQAVAVHKIISRKECTIIFTEKFNKISASELGMGLKMPNVMR